MSRGRFPKRIAGVAVGKRWRRRGERLMAAARHPLVADLTTAAVVALAGALKTRSRRVAAREPAG